MARLLHHLLRRTALALWMTQWQLLCCVLLLAFAGSSYGHTPVAGSIVSTRTWVDFQMPGEIAPQRLYSNTAVATIAPVESITLTGASQFKAQPGARVVIPYLLTNTGNSASHIQLSVTNSSTACSTRSFDLSGLRFVADTNNNGAPDSNEPAVTSIPLDSGQGVTLLLVGDAPQTGSGNACLALDTVTAAQSFGAQINTAVAIDNGAALGVATTASYSGYITPGSTIGYTVRAVNNGVQNASPAGTDGAGVPTTIRIDGQERRAVLLRTLVPAGTTYIGDSLRSGNPGVTKLFRFPGDAPFNYRTVDDASAIEIALADWDPIVPGGALAMGFNVRVAPAAANVVTSQGQASYFDAHADVTSTGNVVVLPVADQRIGVALAVGTTLPQSATTGKVHMTAVVKNYGRSYLYDVQVLHPVESGAAIGSYTASPSPGTGQYSMVPGSMAITQASDSMSQPVPNAAFDGRASGSVGLFGRPVAMAPGSSITVEYDLLINFTGWSESRSTQASARAARVGGATPDITDPSQSGLDPDPTSNGPQNSNAPTFIEPMQMLALHKSVDSIGRLGNGQFDLNYRITVSNVGQTTATRVRLADNLGCALSRAGIQRWSLTAAPTTAQGVLVASGAFTGKAECNAAVDASTGVPLAEALSLTDGTRDLGAGQSETVRFTVRVTAVNTLAMITNTVYAASMAGNTGALLAGTTTSALTMLADPQGIVYDSTTREPIPGATVTISRGACSVGASAAINPAEVYNSELSTYSFNSDGSLSMQTDATGQYQFYWKIPPLASMCTYAIKVAPPRGYVPSLAYKSRSSSFASCGNVAPQATPPQANEPTTWYASVVSGFNPASGAVCEVTHNHIPLDPVNSSMLLLQKVGNKSTAEFGDFLDYQLTLTNRSGVTLAGLSVQDVLPPGLAYVPHSTRFNGVRAAEPATAGGTQGPVLNFSYPAYRMAADATVVVQYRVRIGVGAPTEADVVNRAIGHAGEITSNPASFKTHITGGAFSDDAYVVGKVFLDCNRSGVQDGPDEPGVPGVRLFLEDGTSAITDGEGRWSLFGLKPITHVVRLDTSTLPAGAELQPWDHRNAGAPDSRFVDPAKGELVKANFLLVSCGEAVRAQVQARRQALQAKGDMAELEAAMGSRLAGTPTVAVARSTNGRGLTSSGVLNAGASGLANGSGAPPLGAGALITVPLDASGSAWPQTGGADAARSPGTDRQGPWVVPGTTELEELIKDASQELGFLDLKENDTVLANVVHLRVKGSLETSLKLTVNDKEVPDSRVGKKVSLLSRAIAAWEYIGIDLQPGANVLRLDAVDAFGVARGSQSLRIYAPGGLARLHLDVPKEPRADPLQPITVKVRLADDSGVPIVARTQVTLETDQGEWLAENLNASEPGLHVNIVGGQAELSFRPPAVPGFARLRVRAQALLAEAAVRFIPQDRPMAGIGLVEGVLDLSKRGALTLGQAPAGAAFEQEIQGSVEQTPDSRASARAAFYFKGTILGSYLLTTAYDSNKQVSDRLYRDIQPDQYYPVYGDSSSRSYDAQSSGKLYLRLDSKHSYVLLGDFNTASSEEVRKLSQISRSLNGTKVQYERDNLRVTGYASLDSTAQQIEELPATGVSFYFLRGKGDIVSHSEQVVVVTRLRSQPQVIVSTSTLVRGTDYTFEPLDRRLLLVQPVASFDAELNPQSIRVTYEVASGGVAFAVAGVDAQVKLAEQLQVGAVLGYDENPINKRELRAVTGLATLGKSTVVAGEIAQSQTDLLGQGTAARLEVKYAEGKVKAQAQAQRTSTGFDNPGGGMAAGNEQQTYRFEYQLNPDTLLRADGSQSRVESAQAGVAAVEQQNLSVLLQLKASPSLSGQVGLTQGASSGSGAFRYGALGTDSQAAGSSAASAVLSPARNTMLMAGLEATVPAMPRLQLSAQVAQDLSNSEQHTANVGASYALTDKTRLYARSDYTNAPAIDMALTGGAQTRSTSMGIESAYMEGGRIYDETRFGATGNRNASGLRNVFKLSDSVSVTASAERVTDTSAPAGDSSALALGASYSAGYWRANGAAEWHSQADGTLSSLYSLGVAYKLDRDWTVLGRSIQTLTDGATSGSHLISRQQVGLAWRPAARDDINGLLRLEHRYEKVALAGTALGGADSAFSGAGDGVLPGAYQTRILTALGNYTPRRGLSLTARYAAKWTSYSDDLGSSQYGAQLLHTRVTQDLGENWDIGLQLGALQGQGGARQSTTGVALGYQLFRNAWLTLGYNFIGLKDADLTSNEYTNEGAYIRLRVKFDEHGLGSRETPSRLREANQAIPCASCVNTGTVTPSQTVQPAVPASSPASGPGYVFWSAGQPLNTEVVFSAAQLFDVRAASAVLTAQGRGLMKALGEQILGLGVPEILISVGHGSSAAVHEKLWLSRTASLRRAIDTATGIRNIIRIRVDTQPYGASLPGNEPAVFTLAVIDETASPVLAGENK